ncbi:hypothetical protein GCM10018790_20100 [Kitasatospora xanthocidica]|uniref:DUF5304 family protein n=1 Tax=Kitasatospora xanthocidica TaxID=83382 RepID=UPI0019969EE9|nr:DUF5304 family protein [Kitasatospora xanthocidica]GHF42276.1 hypothetical protein GCM10018790_20100 [Kitasatospora xanthocidica]
MTSTDDRTEPVDDRAEPVGGRTEADGDRAEPGQDRVAADDRAESGGPGEAQAHPFGPELGPLVDEVRRFAGALGEKAQEAGATTLIGLSGLADRLRTQQPEVYTHLAAAGSGIAAAGAELLAAYRAAVAGHESRWTAGQGADTEKIDLDGPDEPSAKQ